jgi:hypothetical protein
MVDHDVIRLNALDGRDARGFDVSVAGLAALLVAKLRKIAEREAAPERWVAKDGLDVLRILRAPDLLQVGATLVGLQKHPSPVRSRGKRGSSCSACLGSEAAMGLNWRCVPALGSKTL